MTQPPAPPYPDFPEQNADGVDLSLIRANLRLTPTERVRKADRAVRELLAMRKKQDPATREIFERLKAQHSARKEIREQQRRDHSGD